MYHEVVLRFGIVAARQAEELVLGRLSKKHAVRFPGGSAQSQALRVPEISKLDVFRLRLTTHIGDFKLHMYLRPYSELVVGSRHEV